jgi:hypothetical protein
MTIALGAAIVLFTLFLAVGGSNDGGSIDHGRRIDTGQLRKY